MGLFSGLLVLDCHCPRLAQRSVIDSSLLKIVAVIEFQCINVHYQLMLCWGGEGHCFWTAFDLLALQLPYIVSTSRMTTSTSPICCSLCCYCHPSANMISVHFQFVSCLAQLHTLYKISCICRLPFECKSQFPPLFPYKLHLFPHFENTTCSANNFGNFSFLQLCRFFHFLLLLCRIYWKVINNYR